MKQSQLLELQQQQLQYPALLPQALTTAGTKLLLSVDDVIGGNKCLATNISTFQGKVCIVDVVCWVGLRCRQRWQQRSSAGGQMEKWRWENILLHNSPLICQFHNGHFMTDSRKSWTKIDIHTNPIFNKEPVGATSACWMNQSTISCGV